MSKKKKTIIIVALLLVVFIGSISYALWSVTLEQTDSNIVKTGCFTVNMVEETDEINLPEEYPVLDSVGNNYSPFTFTIQNTCNIDSSYSVNLKVDTEKSSLNRDSVKVSLNKGTPQILTDYETAADEEKYQLITGTLAGASAEGAGDGESVTYDLRLWLDKDTPDDQMSKDFYAKIIIENITTSGVVAKEVLATADISEAQDGSIAYTYYSTGELEISGTGRMMDYDSIAMVAAMTAVTTNEEFNATLNESEKEALSSDMFMALLPAITKSYYFIYMGLIGDSTPLCASEPTTYEEYRECLATAEFEGTKLFTDSHITLMDKIKESFPTIDSVSISEGITNIGDNALSGLNVEKLILPSTILELGDGAIGSSTIANLTLNDGLTTIGKNAFGSYAKINEIIIPNTVTSIGTGIISDSIIGKITLPKNEQFTTLITYLFEEAQNTTIVIPNTITTMQAYAFASAKGLTINFEVSEENAPFKVSVDGEQFIAVNFGYTE